LDNSGDEDHKVTLSLCDEGLKFVLDEANKHMNLDEDALMEFCPQLKNVDLTSLILKALGSDGMDLSDILSSINEDENGQSDEYILRNPRIGDKITVTREVTSVHGFGNTRTVQYKDDTGKHNNMLAKSWRSYGKNRKVCRK